MNIELRKAGQSDQEIVSNLLQLYLSDVSLHFPIDMDQNSGLYLYDDISKYFDKNTNDIAYIILCDDKLAGFIFMDVDNNTYIIQEIFVLNEFKRKGIGSIAVKKVFDEHKGSWTIKSLPCSDRAEAFWIKTVKEYTKDNFNLDHIGRYNRAVVTFSNE